MRKIEGECCLVAYETYQREGPHTPNIYGFHDPMGVEGPFDCPTCGCTWVLDENRIEEDADTYLIPYVGITGAEFDRKKRIWVIP